MTRNVFNFLIAAACKKRNTLESNKKTFASCESFSFLKFFRRILFGFYYDMFFFMDIVAAARKKLKKTLFKHCVKIPKSKYK